VPITTIDDPASPEQAIGADLMDIDQSAHRLYVGQVAGLVNFGEPTVRVVYDETVPGANTSAAQLVAALQAQMRQQGYSQPASPPASPR
jgi:hypothetical protein